MQSRITPCLLILAIVLLIGLAAMAYGFFNQNTPMIYAGIFVTVITSLLIFIQNILTIKNRKP